MRAQSLSRATGRLRDVFRGHRVLFTLWIVSVAGSLLLTGRLSLFMLDPERHEYSIVPQFEESYHHNCLTAYLGGAILLDQGQQIYDTKAYLPPGNEVLRDFSVDPFYQDPYQYPPQFLLLPAALLLLSNNFTNLRLFWFLVQFITTVGIFLLAAGWIGGRKGLLIALSLPLFWITPNHLVTLQQGNIHFMLICLSVLAMIAFQSGWQKTGGALLAFSTLAKIFPGVLILLLLVQKRIRETLWTISFMAIFTLTLFIYRGPPPFEEFFIHQLPNLLSGEAFKFDAASYLQHLVNISPRGLVQKLQALGFSSSLGSLSQPLSILFTLTVILVTVLLGRRMATLESKDGQYSRLTLLQLWLLLLCLASLQSPFVPFNYGMLGPLWLATLGVVMTARRSFHSLYFIVWLALGVPILLPSLNLLAFLILYGVLAAVAVHLYRRAKLEQPEPGPA